MIGLHLIGHAGRNRIAIEIKLTQRDVKGDRVGEIVQQVVGATTQGRRGQDISTVSIPHKDLNPLRACHVAAQCQIIGSRHAAPRNLSHLLGLIRLHRKSGHRQPFIFPKHLCPGGNTAFATQLEGRGFWFNRDIAIEHIGLTALNFDKQVAGRLRVKTCLRGITVDGVIRIAVDIAEQAVFGVAIRIVTQGEQGRSSNRPFVVKRPIQTGCRIFEMAETIRLQQ